MSEPSAEDLFYDLLFEISNDIRHSILQLVNQKPERMTQIAKKLELTSPEVSRHLTRLSDKHLLEKNSDNLYSVTTFGEYLLTSLIDLEFMTKNINYFTNHTAGKIPIKYQKRLSEISEFKHEKNFMNFIQHIDQVINKTSKYLWFLIDQFPQFAETSINTALERGIQTRIILPIDKELPHENKYTTYQFKQNNQNPVLELRKHPKNDIYVILSDAGTILAFPTTDGIDYTGFLSDKENKWAKELFLHYWDPAEITNAQCALCHTPIQNDHISEVIQGKELIFDTQDCVQTYRQLKQIYGDNFQ